MDTGMCQYQTTQTAKLQTNKLTPSFLTAPDETPYKDRHPIGPDFSDPAAQWPGEHHDPNVTPLPQRSPPTQPRGPNWAAPLPPSFPGLPVRRISTPARLSGPTANSPLTHQPFSALTGGGTTPGTRQPNQHPSRSGTVLAAFSRFGGMLDLQLSDIELGQRIIGEVIRPSDIIFHGPQKHQPDILICLLH